MRKLLIVLLGVIFLITPFCYAAWKFNPHTNKMDYYDASPEVGGGWTHSGTSIYPTTITDNVGIGTTAPVGLLQVGTNPAKPGLLVLPNNNVGIGTTNPSQKLHVAGLIKSDDTKPLSMLLINLDTGTYPEFPLSITETMIVDKVEARTTSGSMSFELRLVDSTGTTPLSTLTAGTATTALLTLIPGSTVPPTNQLVLDIHTTAPRARLTIFKRQY